MAKILISLLFLFNILLLADENPKECTYYLNKDSVVVGWSAFKTAEKIGVKGTFNGINISMYEKAKSLEELLIGSMAIIDTRFLNTSNVKRDKTIFENFFSFLNPLPTIKAFVTDVDTKNLIVYLNITMNGKTKNVPMAFKVVDGYFQAIGKIDIKDFGLSTALDTLNRACFDLHKGVTWSEVEIALEAKIARTCK